MRDWKSIRVRDRVCACERVDNQLERVCVCVMMRKVAIIHKRDIFNKNLFKVLHLQSQTTVNKLVYFATKPF